MQQLHCFSRFCLIMLYLSCNFIAKSIETPYNSGSRKSGGVFFTENKGQVHDQNYKPRTDVLFMISANGIDYHLRNSGISYELKRTDSWKQQSISVFPNPSSGKFFIDANQAQQPLSIKLYNALCQLIYSNELNQEQNSVDLSQKDKGIYFIRIYSGETLLKEERIVLE